MNGSKPCLTPIASDPKPKTPTHPRRPEPRSDPSTPSRTLAACRCVAAGQLSDLISSGCGRSCDRSSVRCHQSRSPNHSPVCSSGPNTCSPRSRHSAPPRRAGHSPDAVEGAARRNGPPLSGRLELANATANFESVVVFPSWALLPVTWIRRTSQSIQRNRMDVRRIRYASAAGEVGSLSETTLLCSLDFGSETVGMSPRTPRPGTARSRSSFAFTSKPVTFELLRRLQIRVSSGIPP